MKHYEKILVGVSLQGGADGGPLALTPDSEQAVARALRIAKRHGAEVTFTSVDDSAQLVGDPRHDVDEEAVVKGAGEHSSVDEERARDLDSTQRAMKNLVARAEAKGVEAASQCRFGKAWQELLNCAAELDVDLIVLGTRCRGSVRRAVFGSTAQRVIAESPQPVLVVQHDDAGAYRRVLIASDLSPGGANVIRNGLALCFGSDCEVEVVHGVENWFDGRWYRAGLLREFHERQHVEDKVRTLKELDQYVVKVASEFGARNPRVRVVSGTPGQTIWGAATDLGADLVVVGHVGRTGIQRLWVGDTADRVLPVLPCSLMTVRMRDNTKTDSVQQEMES